MPITIAREPDNTYRLDIRGLFRPADLRLAEAAVVEAIEQAGPVKLLFVLDAFEGWERGKDWDDASFYAKHGDRISRIAIVGPEKWRDEALMFAGAGLRKGPVEFFPESAAVQARLWLAL